jgi:hypothetical protein
MGQVSVDHICLGRKDAHIVDEAWTERKFAIKILDVRRKE